MSSYQQLREFRSDELECVPHNQKTLGKGGFGTVILAFHKIYNVFAIKCFQKVEGERKEKILEKKVKKELENLQKCNHENVVRVFGWVKNTNVFGIVTEYLPGGNLMELVEEVELATLLKLRICAEVANGLSFIHNFSEGRRLIHGDIKPENVLLTEDLRCKIGDFGSAKISACTGGLTLTTTDATSEKTIQFTQLYAAPEVLNYPLMKPKPSIDTYSYGMLVYVVLCEEVPVNSDAKLELFKQTILNGQRPDLDDIINMKGVLEDNGEVNGVRAMEAMISAMEDCWKQEPSDRPSMLQVKEELCGVLAEIPITKVLQSVADAVREMEVSKPTRKRHNCVPFNQLKLFLPLEPTSLSHTSSAANKQTSQSVMSDEIVQIVRSIISSLERDEVDQVISQTMQLFTVDMPLNNVDVIIDDVIASARYLNSKSEHVMSVKLIGWASGICGCIENPEVKFRKLYDCVDVANDVSGSMCDADMDLYNEQYCLPLLESLLEKLKVISIEDTKFKSEKENWCLNYISHCNHLIGKYEQGIQIASTSLANVMSLYGNDAPKHHILANCYDLLGVVNYGKGDYARAVEYWKRELEALQSVEDISKRSRRQFIESTHVRLRQVQTRL